MASSIVIPYRLNSTGSNTDATSYASGSVAGVSGHVCIAAVANYRASSSATPTASGTNGFNTTWTQIGTVEVNSDGTHYCRLTVFRGVLASAVAGVLTFDFGGETQLAAIWDIWDVPLIDTTTPVVQFKTSSDISGSTTFALTQMDAAPSGPNPVLVVVAQQAASGPGGSPAITAAALAPAVGASSTNVSDGLGLRMYLIGSQGYSMSGVTASVAKVGMLIELTHDGTGVEGGDTTVINQQALMDTRQAGATDQTVDVQMFNTTTGAPVTAIAHSDITQLHYVRQKAAPTSFAAANLAAIDSAHSDGGWEQYDATDAPGWYRLDLPDAAVASGVPRVTVVVQTATARGEVVIDLTADDPRGAALTAAGILTAAESAPIAANMVEALGNTLAEGGDAPASPIGYE